MKKLIIPLCISAMFMAAACNNSTSADKKADNQTQSTGDSTKVVYQCPMDCEKGKTYDQPGKCPVCEMDLEKVSK